MPNAGFLDLVLVNIV